MFELDYRIIHSEYDDFIGQNGFFQINCNAYNYGEIYPKELEVVMDKVSVYDWFERLIKVTKKLSTEDYVVLSDVESYNTWIEFQRRKQEVIISIIKAEKKQNSRDIEFKLEESSAGEWVNQVVSYNQLRNEIIEKAEEYIKYISANNADNVEIDKIKQKFEEIV